MFAVAQGSNLLATGVLLLETFANEKVLDDVKKDEETTHGGKVWLHLAEWVFLGNVTGAFT